MKIINIIWKVLMVIAMGSIAGIVYMILTWDFGVNQKPVVKVDNRNVPRFQANTPTSVIIATPDVGEDISELKKQVQELKKKLEKSKITPTPIPTVIYFEPYYEPTPILLPSTTPIIPSPSVMPPSLKIANCRSNLSDGVYEVRTGLTQVFEMTYDKPIDRNDYTWFTAWAKPAYGNGSRWSMTFNDYGKHLVRLTDKWGQKDECWVNIIQ